MLFYGSTTGNLIGEISLDDLITLQKGSNSVTLSRSALPGGAYMNWAVKLEADAIENFGLVYADASLTYGRAYAGVDRSPESNYFGRIYVANRKSSKIASRLYFYNPTYTKDANAYTLGESLWAFGRFDVAENGKLYLSDYSDDHSGCFIVDPSNLTSASQFFAGTRGGTGLFTYNTVETGSSLAAVHIYGKGANAKMFAVAEDYTGYTDNKFPVAIYNIGNANGTLKESWTTTPNTLFQTLGNDAQNFDIRGCAHGAWVATSRSTGNNSDMATSLRFYDMEGNCTYSSHEHTDDINGSLGGGFTITEDGNTLYLVNGSGNIMKFSVSWSGDTPTLSKVTTYTTTYNAISSMQLDYAGNLIVTAGKSFVTSDDNQLGLSVYALPTADNTCTVPAKKSLRVYAPLNGTFNVGGDAYDFASLASAIDTLETYGLSGDVTFRICSDLTETKNIGIINTTAHTISIVPDGTVKRTITYGDQADNAGPSGHIVIGERMGLGWSDAVATQNVVIDGSFNSEGQYLEFRGGAVGGSVIVVYGDVTNTTIRNCRIVHPRESGTNNALHFRTERNTNNAPNGVVAENCYLEVLNGTAQAIQLNGSQATTSSGYPHNNIIRNCQIVSALRGVFVNYADGAIIEGNTFRIIEGASGFLSHGIMGDNQIGTFIVRGNKFIELSTLNRVAENYGINGITAQGTVQATKWMIENNYFAGLNALASDATSKDFILSYIRCNDSCVVRHNTFRLPSLKYKPATALTSANPIACLYLAGSYKYPVQNNIFVSDETVANNSLIRGNLNENIQNNVLYHAGGNAAIVAGTITYTTFADLPAAYQTANIDQKVTFSSDYHISDTYVGNLNLGVTPIAGITTDIDGNLRHNPTYAGCFEASDWSTTSLYLDETQNNTANIAAAEAANVPTNVTLNRRFVVADALYTLILPFDLSAAQLAEAFGAGYKLMELSESYMKTESMMYINFVPASSLTAGKPYLFQTGEDIDHDIVFSGVTIKSTINPITTELVDMSGVYDPTIVSYSDNNYFLGNNDYLYPYTDQTPTTKGFRAYFHFHDAPANCVARVVFRDDVTTDLEDETFESAPAVQKIIRNGQLIIIRDGIEYNAQGQVIK